MRKKERNITTWIEEFVTGQITKELNQCQT